MPIATCKNVIFSAFAVLAIGIDATSVAVMEFGNVSTMHRTMSTASETSASGVLSFFKSLHEVYSNGKVSRSRSTQYPGMSVVPNLFNRPNGGIAIGISVETTELVSMPTLASILEEKGTIGNFNIKSSEGKLLMKQMEPDSVDIASFESVVETRAKAAACKDGNKLESVTVNFESIKSAVEFDTSLARSLKSVAKHAEETESTIIVYLIIQENDEDFNRRVMTRRSLDEQEEEDENNKNDNEDGDGNDDGEYDSSQFGYYANGKYYQPYRKMSEIQYFNIVLWTSVGLCSVMFAANWMTMYMPLMPDTLLFGESAKVVAE